MILIVFYSYPSERILEYQVLCSHSPPDRQPRFYVYSSGLVNMRLVRSTKTPLVHTCITESKEHRFIPNMTEIFLAILLWMCTRIVWKLNVNTEVSDNPGAYSPLNRPGTHVNL